MINTDNSVKNNVVNSRVNSAVNSTINETAENVITKGSDNVKAAEKLAAVLNSPHFSVRNVLKFIALFMLSLLIYTNFLEAQQDDKQTTSYVFSPKVDDVYFLDFRVLSDNLRPTEKYRIAKVVDITGDVITLLYGNVFYLRQQSLIDSIRYGQLRYKGYFESKRYDLTLTQLKQMHDAEAIYMIKRPDNNMLYGNYVNEPKAPVSSKVYIPGKRINASGLSFLKSTHIENNFQQAFEHFSRSAQLGFAKGQINLGQMYVNAQYVEKDLSQALFWFKQAALQSDKAAVLKYVIVCRQVSYCYEADFYQELTDAGVNIKVRELDFKLD